jgi:uncharacterized membrane protein YdjX (TVP38/TMEM64 family)
MDKRKNTRKLFTWLLIIIGGLAGIMIYAGSSGILANMTSMEAFQDYVRGFGTKASIVFFLIQLLSVVIAPIPSNISTAAGASIFGLWEAFFLSTLAIVCGSIIVFLLARKFGKPFTDKFVSPKVANKYGQLISSKRDLLLALLFLLPFFPDDSICLLAGLSQIGSLRFFVIMLLTRPWGILAASAVGSADITVPWWGWAIAVLASVLILKYGSQIEEKLTGAFKTN